MRYSRRHTNSTRLDATLPRQALPGRIPALRRCARRGFGGAWRIKLERDTKSREPDTPYDFLKALERRPAARRFYDRASVALRREIGNWLAAAKRPETRQRRIEAALDNLEARASPNKKSDFTRKRR